jgi:hypothetical protein
MNTHSHAKNVFGLNDLMGMYAVTFSPKGNASAPLPKAAPKAAPKVLT